ncbi:hypothetical protein SAMN05192574_102818 [Mucilaginibacter gossypiicola]|uniref:Uncharacterized protein n=1 Tax=Mucilaginibacter gossypiicola TaxID=551995 RepID=A0A1H8ES28_9SPHI|nr:hypothetical protein [Mucilaginibacter gossypiicola]SEN22176.1 hypothetical protein SAMN05192574_102818 [Mucilaginibacter gossypiicola]
MKKKNIETDFIQFIIDKYSPNPGATASKNDDEKSSDEQSDNDEDENQEVVEKLLLEYKKIKDKYEYYSLQSKIG